MLPGGAVDAVRDVWRGGDIDVNDARTRRANGKSMNASRPSMRGNIRESVLRA